VEATKKGNQKNEAERGVLVRSVTGSQIFATSHQSHSIREKKKKKKTGAKRQMNHLATLRLNISVMLFITAALTAWRPILYSIDNQGIVNGRSSTIIGKS